MAFEVFKRRSRPITGDPIIGIQNRGTISLNAPAFHLLKQQGGDRFVKPEGNAEALVELLYDREDGLVGLRLTQKGPNAYPVRKQPQSESFLITGKGFFQYYSIPTNSIQRFLAKDLGEGIIGFALADDLNKTEQQEELELKG